MRRSSRALPRSAAGAVLRSRSPADGHIFVAGVDAARAATSAAFSRQAKRGSGAGWPCGQAEACQHGHSRMGALYVTVHDEGVRADRLLRWSSERGWEDKARRPDRWSQVRRSAMGKRTFFTSCATRTAPPGMWKRYVRSSRARGRHCRYRATADASTASAPIGEQPADCKRRRQ